MANVFQSACTGLSVACLILGTGPVAAQGVPGALYTITVPSSQFGSSAYLSVLTGSLGAAKAFCKGLNDPALNVDCLSERLSEVAKQIPSDSDYSDVRSVLNDTSRKLNKLARANRDRGRGAVRAASNNAGSLPPETARPIVAIEPAKAAAVNAEATRILEEAQTVLLRSAEGNAIKAGQYSKIAQALDSNKVLLRSA
ncbi:MAG: hypothetical protein ACWA5A_06660 [Marinibacterium sp.]